MIRLSRLCSWVQTTSQDSSNSNQIHKEKSETLTQGQEDVNRETRFYLIFVLFNRIQNTIHLRNVSGLGLQQCFFYKQRPCPETNTALTH